MDEFLRQINFEIYKIWIKYQLYNDTFDNIQENNDIETEFIFQSKKCSSKIRFNKNEIIELIVMNDIKNTVEFYLHFQMNNMKHAKSIFYEMMRCMRNNDEEPTIKVLLCCSSGLTTSYFVMKLEEAIQNAHLDIKILATSYEKIFKIVNDYDMLLLAPQISYKKSEAKKSFKDIIIEKIPALIFAKYDTNQMIQYIFDLYSKKQNSIITSKPISHFHLTKNGQYICMSIYENHFHTYITYRIYNDNHQIIYENEIIKSGISVDDIYGVLDANMDDNIQMIAISLPGIVYNGIVSSSSIYGVNGHFRMNLNNKYHREILIYNDVHAAAIGFHQFNNEYSSFCLLFQPVGLNAKLGTIIHNQFIEGNCGLAGELKFMSHNENYRINRQAIDPQDALEFISNTIIDVTSIISPNTFVICSDFIDDMEILKKKIYQHFKAHISHYHLKLIKIDNIQEYILTGLSSICKK